MFSSQTSIFSAWQWLSVQYSGQTHQNNIEELLLHIISIAVGQDTLRLVRGQVCITVFLLRSSCLFNTLRLKGVKVMLPCEAFLFFRMSSSKVQQIQKDTVLAFISTIYCNSIPDFHITYPTYIPYNAHSAIVHTQSKKQKLEGERESKLNVMYISGQIKLRLQFFSEITEYFFKSTMPEG